MKLLSLAIVLFLLPGPQSTRATEGHVPEEKLHPDLLRVVAELGPSKAWVFLRDKDLGDASRRVKALEEARARLSPRTLERRRARRVGPGLVDERDAALAPAYVQAVLATGVELVVESTWLNALSVRGDGRQFRAIAALDCVTRVEPVRRGILVDASAPGLEAEASLDPASSTPSPPLNYGSSFAQLDQIGVVDLHLRGYAGSGVVVGILDTGFHRGHEAFNQAVHEVQVVAEHDFIDGDGNTDIEVGDPSGQHSHGTYILGTLGAYLPGSLVGGAYEAAFILCKTEDTTDEYQQEEDFYVAGLQFIEANGGDLATSSLGYIDWYTQGDLDGATAVTTLAVNAATQNGMPCVTAAGNSGHDTNPATSSLIAPADALEVITSGAVDSTGVIAGFSSSGPSADGRVKPELLARGVNTWTVCASSDFGCTTQVSGTSLSTPLLAGLVACLLDAHPDWTVGQLRARLFRTGNDFLANGTHDPLYVRGFGIPDGNVAGFDCNGNGVDDDLDIASGTSTDCNANGYPDSCDIADGISLDGNADGTPDECGSDCDGDGVPDELEADCNANGIPDDCEELADCNANGVPDVCESFADCNAYGIPDECDADCNGNGIPDDCESLTDCNANGVPDECETLADCNANGVPDVCESLADCNANGVPDVCETLADCNANGIPDECENFADCNGNGVPDECEVDCDGDGLPDACEVDCNANGTPDDCEALTDCNANGTPDVCETLADCNANGVPDVCENFADCNGNGVPDECDPDANGNGIPDDCEPTDTVAGGEAAVQGTVSGSFINTQAGDGVRESIREVESKGKPASRYSLLEHKWTLTVPPSPSATLFLRAHHTANTEGDDFVFAWSTDNVNYSSVLTLTSTSDVGYASAPLPATPGGTIWIRVRDTNRTQGRRALDTVLVDHLFIRTE